MNTELDLQKVVRILLQNVWFILAACVVMGLAAYGISAYLITPTYDATTSLYVYNEKSRAEDITSTDLATSQRLVQTYIVILTSNSVLEEVSRRMDGEVTAAYIRKELSAAAIDSTEAFRVTVTDPDPLRAQRIANTIADTAPEQIIRVVKAGSVEVIDHATLPLAPSAPNKLRNTAIGALLGLVLAAMIVILRSMFDTVIRTEEELTAVFQIPILGVIPSITESDVEEGYGYGQK